MAANMQEPIPFNLEELYEERLIVLLERGAQSNKYRQVLLTPTQFQALSTLLQSFMKHDLDGSFDVPVSSKATVLPSELNSFYEPGHSAWKK